uniref:RGS domain-containing protein n=1 Tax=Felis catus TaxID=9685 RepID=A0ABI7WZU6_FELCA
MFLVFLHFLPTSPRTWKLHEGRNLDSFTYRCDLSYCLESNNGPKIIDRKKEKQNCHAHNNQHGLASFKSFLKSEFSEENLEFWLACEDYKKIKSPAKMAEKAKKIYEEFIQTEAPKEVNIDHFTKDITTKNLVEPSPSSFDVAQKRIYALMEKDSLPRFVRSEFYQELIK